MAAYDNWTASLNAKRHAELIAWLEQHCEEEAMTRSGVITEALYAYKQLTQRYGDWRLTLDKEPRWLENMIDRLADRLDGQVVKQEKVEAIGQPLKLDFDEEDLF